MNKTVSPPDHLRARLVFAGKFALIGGVLVIAAALKNAHLSSQTPWGQYVLYGMFAGGVAGVGRFRTLHWTSGSRARRFASWAFACGLAALALLVALLVVGRADAQVVLGIVLIAALLPGILWIEEDGLLRAWISPRLFLPALVISVSILLLIVFSLE